MDNSHCPVKASCHNTTDANFLSVMDNIDNRIEDEGLKTAVRGIGTEVTGADVIERLIEVDYAERKGKNIVSTSLGRDFINSLPSFGASLFMGIRL